MKTLFENGNIISANLELPGGAMLIEGSKITELFSSGDALPAVDNLIDLHGATILPGFIDIHSHGHSGADFCDATDEAFSVIATGKLADGVTTMLPATLSVSTEDIVRTLSAAARYMKRTDAAPKMPGLHLEGPFFNPDAAGAQNPEFLKAPDIDLVQKWNKLAPLKIVSYSPEMPGAIKFTEKLSASGIMPSGAHSTADYEIFRKAREAGMKHLTHFCNVMTPLHHLNFGMVGGGLLSDDVMVEIIPDGVHICDEMLKLIFRIKGPDRIMMITDSMRGTGMADGISELGGLKVIIKDGKATLESGKVAGSTLKYFRGLQRLRHISGLPPSEVIKCAGYNQARSLGLEKTGMLQAGFSADFLIADSEWTPEQVWVNGICRWNGRHECLS